MAIENIDYCPQHFAHGTSKLKEDKGVEEDDKQKSGHAISPDGLTNNLVASDGVATLKKQWRYYLINLTMHL